MQLDGNGGAGLQSEINVTPLVDVVLVLLIIFMVVVPLLPSRATTSTSLNVSADAPPPLVEETAGDPEHRTHGVPASSIRRKGTGSPSTVA